MQFATLGVFLGDGDGIITLEPVVNRALLDLHEQLFEMIRRHAGNIPPYYAPGNWSPHITVGFRVPRAEIGRHVEVLRENAPPRSGQITGVLFGGFHIEGGSVLEQASFRKL